MKVNQWTLGLAAIGLVTLPAALQAEEKLNPLLTAMTPTTLSGYVSTSMEWVPGRGNAIASPRLYQAGKADGFNLDVVALSLAKPLDEGNWSAGYNVDLWFGPDANAFGSQSGESAADLAIKQAYIALRAPLGNGLDFKVGVFDSIVGYESHDSHKNPNYTRSYAVSLEPHTHTGVLVSYQFCPTFAMSAGVANTDGPAINQRANPPKAESFKTYMASAALTAPDDWGFVSGSSLYVGFVNGWSGDATGGDTLLNLYAGVVLNTPVKDWRFGGSYDWVRNTDDAVPGAGQTEDTAWAVTLYSSYQFTEKVSLHLRGEYAVADANIWGTQPAPLGTPGGDSELFGVTATLQYDLWKNVISRLELIWDHQAGDNDMAGFGGDLEKGETSGGNRNNYTLALNLIYKF